MMKKIIVITGGKDESGKYTSSKDGAGETGTLPLAPG
jgi:hypothetical protein